MLIGSFKAYTPAALIKVPLFAIFLWAFSPLYSHLALPSESPTGMPFYLSIAGFPFRHYYASVFISLLINLLSAFLLNYIVNHHNLLSKKTYLPALFFLCYSACCGELLTLSAASFANLLLIAACHELFNTYRKDSALKEIFNSGMLIGLSTLLYFPSLLLFIFVWITLIINRPFIWQEYIVSLLGLLLPLTYFVVYYFWINQLGTIWHGTLHNHMAFKHDLFRTTKPYLLLYIVFGIIILMTLLRLANSTIVFPLKSKKGLSLLFWCFVLALLSLFFSPDLGFPALKMTALPLAVFTANLFIQMKKDWIAEMLFTCMLLTILFVHLSAYLGK